MKDEDGDLIPQTEDEWKAAEALLRKHQDWSEALSEDRKRTSVAAFQLFRDGHITTVNPNGGFIHTPKPGYVQKYYGTRKVYPSQ